MKLDPIIAVKDIQASSQWYCSLLGCRDLHGGGHFAILVNDDDEVLVCLHQWEEDDHPTMQDPAITPGNGLILYLRTDNIHTIRQQAAGLGLSMAEEVHLNSNSMVEEFSVRDPDGYFLTISAFHRYGE